MNKPTFQRARTPEAKARRRADILAAAAAVLDSEGLEGTTLNAIAARAGVAKSNIYRYFESREEILMRLLTEDLRNTGAALESLLPAPRPIPDITEIFVQGLAGNPRLCLLISIFSSILEHNISTTTLRDIKREMLISLEQSATALRRGLPELSPPQAENAVQILFALVGGIWPMSQPGPALQALYAEPEFSKLKHNFEKDLSLALQTMLKGLTA